MIDSIRLLVFGVCAAALAWGLWTWLGQTMFLVLNAVVVVSLAVDNRRLRNRLSRLGIPPRPPARSRDHAVHSPSEP